MQKEPLRTLANLLEAEGSRAEGVDHWARKWAPHGDLAAHWKACTSPDALLVVFGEADHRSLVRAACGVARAALPMLLPGNSAPEAAIVLVERWTRGEIERSGLDGAWQSIRVPELNESKGVRRTVYAPAAARAAVRCAVAERTPGLMGPQAYARSAIHNAAYALAGPARRHLAYASLADVVRSELACPEMAAIVRRLEPALAG